MKKTLTLIFFLLLTFADVAVQAQCYNRNRSMGIELYNAQDYVKAKECFTSARDCPDRPDKDDLNVWIQKCDDKLNPPQTITVGKVSFKMTYVRGGTFTMGSDVGKNEGPAHSVTLRDFYIGETEVTQALWAELMADNPSDGTPGRGIGDNVPVNRVSWEDCQEFIRRLNAITGMDFRLPTEAEWEYAARGGENGHGFKYSGSDTLDSVAYYWKNSGYTYMSGSESDWDWDRIIANGSRAHNVSTKRANELGVYDMSGNVREWCSDWYGSYGSSPQTNPVGSDSGSYRVARGGGWGSKVSDCRVSYRTGFKPSYNHAAIGLRLVLPSSAFGTTAQHLKDSLQSIDKTSPTTGNLTRTFTVRSVNFTMVYVEGSTFTIDIKYGSRKIVNDVTLSNYYIGETEVTQALWYAVMGDNPSEWKGDNLPVENVRYTDCVKFIRKLNRLTGCKFRLPTEAEWVYAARGGVKSRGYTYSGSYICDDVAWYAGNSNEKTHPVAQKRANELGLYDMSGNVSEWCCSWPNDYSRPGHTNPIPLSWPIPFIDDEETPVIYMGSNWEDKVDSQDISDRTHWYPSNHRGWLGFRLVLVP